MWMVVGIPGLTIVAGLVTWWIAAQRADSDVADDHYKRGLAINRVLEREEAARVQGIRAVITAPDSGERSAPQVRLQGPALLPEAITVQLTHPVSAAQDRRFALAIQPDGSYRLPVDLPRSEQRAEAAATSAGRAGSPAQSATWPTSGHWTVSVETAQWRLSGQQISLSRGASVSLPASQPVSPQPPGGRHATNGS